MSSAPRIYGPFFPEYRPIRLFKKFICATPPPPPESTPPSQNIPPFSTTMRPSRNLPLPPSQNTSPFLQIHMCDPPRIYPSLSYNTPFSTNSYVRPSQNLPLPPRIYPPPFSTTICDAPIIYSSLPEYIPDFYIGLTIIICSQNVPIALKNEKYFGREG